MGFLFQVIFAWVCLKIGHPQKSMLYHGHFPDLKWPFWVLYRPTVYSYSTSFSDMLRCLCQQQNHRHQASLHLALAMVTALNRRAAEPLEAGHVGHVRFGATWGCWIMWLEVFFAKTGVVMAPPKAQLGYFFRSVSWPAVSHQHPITELEIVCCSLSMSIRYS